MQKARNTGLGSKNFPYPVRVQRTKNLKTRGNFYLSIWYQIDVLTLWHIILISGQRIYGGPPPNWKGQAPVKGTEIFVGKVPREMFEWELVPIFEKVIFF